MLINTLYAIAAIIAVFAPIALLLQESNSKSYRKIKLTDGNGKEWYRVQVKKQFMFYTWWETEWYDPSDHPDMCLKAYFEFDTADEADKFINKRIVKKYYH